MKSSEGELLSSIKKELTFTKEKLAALEKVKGMRYLVDKIEGYYALLLGVFNVQETQHRPVGA